MDLSNCPGLYFTVKSIVASADFPTRPTARRNGIELELLVRIEV